jgi:cbb3-type cytochrome oxidase subunit 3
MPDIDINYLRGAALLLLIIAFLAMWKWAWSDKRKADFKKMSELPLEEDRDGEIPDGSTVKTEKSEAKE